MRNDRRGQKAKHPKDKNSRPKKKPDVKPVSKAQNGEASGERIAKYIARCGICSRRDAEKLIISACVTINGDEVAHPSAKVNAGDVVKLDGEVIRPEQDIRLFLYHKPTGLVTTHKDEKGRKTIFDAISELKIKDMPRLVSVGRLDLNSEGLILLTNSGELAGKLGHPKTGWKRKYKVRVHGTPTEDQLDKLRLGVIVDGIKYGRAKIEYIRNKDKQKSAVSSRNSWFEVTLTEGKNREIRNMFAAIGCPVNRLLRVSYGPFDLGKLKIGEMREVPDFDAGKYL